MTTPPTPRDLLEALRKSLQDAREIARLQAQNGYQVARCGQLSVHALHVVEHGPDQPRNCPGVRP